MSQQWSEAQNILCVRLDAIGDVLMTTPAIRALKESRPDRRITLLTSPSGSAIAALIPEIDEVIVYDAPWLKATAPRPDSKPDFERIDRLRSNRFDAAVIFTVFSQNPLPSALLTYLADIPLRLAHCRENPYQLLTHWVLDPEPSQGIRHEVRRQLDLVATVGCQTTDERLSVRVEDSDRRQVHAILGQLDVQTSQPWVVIHPGATASSRRYPPEKFAEVARRLAVEQDFQIIFTGTEAERSLIETIQSQVGTFSHTLIDRLSLGEMLALLAIAPLLISNNTGPVHMAAAVGTPVVDLYALTNPQHTPWMVPNRVLYHDVPCKFCYKSVCPEKHHHCLEKVTPDEVVRAASELFQEAKGQGKRNLDSKVLMFSNTPVREITSSVVAPAQSAKHIWH